MFHHASRKPYTVVEYEPGPCPVCGAEGGNCRGESPMYDHNIKFLPPQKHADPSATFTVPHRIYEEHVSPTGKRSRKLIYAKGDRIRPSEARRLGLMQ